MQEVRKENLFFAITQIKKSVISTPIFNLTMILIIKLHNYQFGLHTTTNNQFDIRIFFIKKILTLYMVMESYTIKAKFHDHIDFMFMKLLSLSLIL